MQTDFCLLNHKKRTKLAKINHTLRLFTLFFPTKRRSGPINASVGRLNAQEEGHRARYVKTLPIKSIIKMCLDCTNSNHFLTLRSIRSGSINYQRQRHLLNTLAAHSNMATNVQNTLVLCCIKDPCKHSSKSRELRIVSEERCCSDLGLW